MRSQAYTRSFTAKLAAGACAFALLAAPARASDPPPVGLAPAVAAAESMPRLYSLLVSRGGERILERYFNGTGPGHIANVKSVSKSVISALVGIAIRGGKAARIAAACNGLSRRRSSRRWPPRAER